MKSIRIGKTFVGKHHPTYIIAEIGSNFDGSLKKAKELITLAKKSGADCAKFQSFLTDKLLSKTGFEKQVSFQSKWKKTVLDVYREAELPREWHVMLAEHARKLKIDFMSTPYDYEAVDLLDKIGVPAFKIGSGDVTYLEFLKYIAKKNKPVLLPTGASTLDEIHNAIKVIKSVKNYKIILLQSVTQYPSPLRDANVLAMVKMGQKFGLNVGYSDHSPSLSVPIASVALGACMIEKHFTDNPKNKGPDHPHSLGPREFSEMVRRIREVEILLGDGMKKVAQSERETRIIQRRSIFSVMPIKKGERFTATNVKCLRPCIALPASELSNILKRRAKRNLEPYTGIKKEHFY